MRARKYLFALFVASPTAPLRATAQKTVHARLAALDKRSRDRMARFFAERASASGDR